MGLAIGTARQHFGIATENGPTKRKISRYRLRIEGGLKADGEGEMARWLANLEVVLGAEQGSSRCATTGITEAIKDR
jgi:hypothetical protein